MGCLATPGPDEAVGGAERPADALEFDLRPDGTDGWRETLEAVEVLAEGCFGHVSSDIAVAAEDGDLGGTVIDGVLFGCEEGRPVTHVSVGSIRDQK